MIDDQAPQMIECAGPSNRSPVLYIKPIGLADFSRSNHAVNNNFKFAGDEDSLCFSPTHEWMSTTFLNKKEKGIEVIGQKIDIRAKDDEDDDAGIQVGHSSEPPIKQNFIRRTVKRFMHRKGSPIPQSGQSPSLRSMNDSNDSVLSWSSEESVASIDNRDENHEAKNSLIMPPNKVNMDRPSRPNLDEGYGPSGSFIGMKAVSTPELYALGNDIEPKGFLSDSPDAEWRVRSSETFIIRKASPNITPTSSVFDLERYVGTSQTSLYEEEEVAQEVKIASSFDSLFEEEGDGNIAKELPIFSKSSDSLEALINEVFKDASDAVLLGKEMPAPYAAAAAAAAATQPLTDVVIRGLGDCTGSTNKRVYTEKELRDLERQILMDYG